MTDPRQVKLMIDHATGEAQTPLQIDVAHLVSYLAFVRGLPLWEQLRHRPEIEGILVRVLTAIADELAAHARN